MAEFDSTVINLVENIGTKAVLEKKMISCAESCTGGLIAAAFTSLAGSSRYFDTGFVTYSNEAKMALLSVPEDMLVHYGAVSEPVARAMAHGALAHSRAHISVAVTGVAGPGGGTLDKPVGCVHLACTQEGDDIYHKKLSLGNLSRFEIRYKTLVCALEMIVTLLENGKR